MRVSQAPPRGLKDAAALGQLRIRENADERCQYAAHHAEQVPVHSVLLSSSEEMANCGPHRNQNGQYEKEWHVFHPVPMLPIT